MTSNASSDLRISISSMPNEDPYQSPSTDSVAENRVFRQFPTWKFWVLIILALPGLGSIFLQMKYLLGNALDADWFLRNIFYFALGGLLFSSCGVWVQWPTPSSYTKPGQKAVCLFAIVGFTAMSAFCFGNCVSSIVWALFFGSPYWYYTSQLTRHQILLCGAISACIPFSLGIALGFDAIGRPLRLRSMFAKMGIPRLR